MQIIVALWLVVTLALASAAQIPLNRAKKTERGMGLLYRPNDPNGAKGRQVSQRLAGDFSQLRLLASKSSSLNDPSLDEETKEEIRLVQSLPETFDLRDELFVTSVKNQRSCGSCVSFAVMATIESSYHKQKNIPLNGTKPLDLSESSLYACTARVECDPGGMYLDDALEIVERVGVQLESSLPYNHTNLVCDRKNSRFLPLAFRSKFLPSVALVQEWMRTKGAVLTRFDVPDDFEEVLESNNNVYDVDHEPEYTGGHAVACVGYDNTYRNKYGELVGAWICKNSWGLDFGDYGYFKVAFGQLGLMAETFGVIVEESKCQHGRKRILDRTPLTNNTKTFDASIDVCDAARLGNEREIGYWGWYAKYYLKEGLAGYHTGIDCHSSALTRKNDFELDVLSRNAGQRLFGATVEQIYTNIGCRVIEN